MATAARAPDDAARLASLRAHCVLDTPPDPRFDELVRVTAAWFGTPMAAINLIDADRQWSKAAVGFAQGTNRDLEESFCAWTIRSPDQLTIVPDASRDLRFAHMPRVAGAPGIRFYAGAPLVDREGYVLGALAVLDVRVRTLEAPAREMLASLGRITASQLELHRVNAELKESHDHHRNASELNHQMPWTASAEGRIEEVSSRWCRETGMSVEDARQEKWRGTIHPDDLPDLSAAWAESLRRGVPFDCEHRLKTANSGYRWIRERAAARCDDAGRVLRWYGTIEDIHERKTAEIALRESERRLRFALGVGRLGSWELDLDTFSLSASDLCAANFGRRYGSEISHFDEVRAAVHPDDRDRQLLEVNRAIATGGDLDIEYRNLWTDGSIHWVRSVGRAIYGEGGEPLRMVGLSLDVTERRQAELARQQAEARMTHLANHDPLTGVANRRLLDASLKTASAAATPDARAALLCIDLDQFKAINDVLDHDAGDLLLKLVAGRLQELSAAEPQETVIARYNGDAFMVLATGVRSRREAAAIAERVLRSLGEAFLVEGRSIILRCSIGISLAPDDATEASQLRRNAHTALRRAKPASRGGYRFFEPEMDRRLQMREELKLGLQGAVAAGELMLAYQPLLDLASGRVAGFEALMRWRHPERGLLLPAEFIPVAEDTGHIVQLGGWALREACREAARWPKSVSVAVNLSAMQVAAGPLAAELAEALAQSGLDPGRLELEVTESLLLQDTDTNADVLQSLRRMGVRIVMDDFGAGYSSLGYLRRFTFDKIKLDKSLVRGLPDGAGGEAIVRAVLGLSRSLGIAITAEGVETREQLEYLRAEGCAQVQGFLFSPAVSAAEVPAMLNRNWPGLTGSGALFSAAE